ncbi:MAG: universal stress protein [Proteobacteria bacterium]|nr:universal stress protein [Pseudomonadota bacterium]
MDVARLAAADNILQDGWDRATRGGGGADLGRSGCGRSGDADHRGRHSRQQRSVVGSRGRGRLIGLVLGSVARKVVNLAPCPVVVVRSRRSAQLGSNTGTRAASTGAAAAASGVA